MPERVGVAAAGRRVRCSRHDKLRSPAGHNPALYSIAPTGLRRRQEPCAELNITSSCAVPGQAKQNPRRAVRAALARIEHRKFCWSPMPAAERSELLSARGSTGRRRGSASKRLGLFADRVERENCDARGGGARSAVPRGALATKCPTNLVLTVRPGSCAAAKAARAHDYCGCLGRTESRGLRWLFANWRSDYSLMPSWG